MGYVVTVATVKPESVHSLSSIMSWDSTFKSTDIKYIHEDILTNKTTRWIESRTASVQKAQAEHLFTDQSQVGGARRTNTMILVMFYRSTNC